MIKKSKSPTADKTDPKPRYRDYLSADSKVIHDEFVNACLEFDPDKVGTLFKKHPALIDRVDPDLVAFEDPYSLPFLERVMEIFAQFNLKDHSVEVSDRDCTGCSWGGWTKMFVVTDRNNSKQRTSFGFLMKVKENEIIEIFECSQYKVYQDKLGKRMFAGMSDQEIAEAQEAAKRLPDLRKYKDPF